jgi:cytochrome c oxidase accessory protein FixG
MKQSSCPGESPSLLSPWRRRCQWLTTLLLLALPWFNIDGKSILRVDIPELSLYVFGQTLRIEELYIVLLFSLFITLAFLLLTMVLGRVWCGWFCPQTTLTDLAEWCANRLGLSGKKVPKASILKKLFLQTFYLLLAFLVSCNLLWYFIEPLEFFQKLISLQLHYASWITLLLVAFVIYFDLAFIQRLMCSEFCPYGRFQTVLADQSTLALSLPREELERCIKCNSCVRVCPMGIDIREGFQVECINCGRCLDACRVIMAKRSQPGLISYNFGTEKQGARGLLNAKTLMLSIVTMALFMILAIAIYDRPKASLKISVSHKVASRVLKDGNQATLFNAWVNNRSDSSESYRIIARSTDKKIPLEIKGKVFPVIIEDGGNVRVDFVLITPLIDSRLDVEFILLDQLDNELAITAAQVRKP